MVHAPAITLHLHLCISQTLLSKVTYITGMGSNLYIQEYNLYIQLYIQEYIIYIFNIYIIYLYSGYNYFLSVFVFLGNWTHNLLRCQHNALRLSYRNTTTCVPHLSHLFKRARAWLNEPHWTRYRAVTLVKLTGLWGSIVLKHGSDPLVWVHPKLSE